MKKIKELILGLSIFWLPILGMWIATKLEELITMDMIVNGVIIIGILAVIELIRLERRS